MDDDACGDFEEYNRWGVWELLKDYPDFSKQSNNYDNSKDQYRKLLSETLGIISSMKHLYTSDEMGRVILQLQTLSISDSGLSKCKPNLVAFVAGLGHIQFEETDNNNSKVSAKHK
ncbi:hypothetical protein CTI12_AA574900 [Artemisia annua]|uniref:Uncharacterized protein n=1 Tax=Artemisia annua TaxID=35608 RepID=A0A2U1KQT6_ARTAN|nr:hypothetical protein CTI12_AA574900 [Artemisia annua]